VRGESGSSEKDPLSRTKRKQKEETECTPEIERKRSRVRGKEITEASVQFHPSLCV
jgi:hypothetical protein